jgi:hypothetical protein
LPLPHADTSRMTATKRARTAVSITSRRAMVNLLNRDRGMRAMLDRWHSRACVRQLP